MGTIREILARKGTQVWSVGKDATVLDAALIMNEHRIGALVVLEEGRVIGMFSERDVLQRVVAAERDPALTRVAEVMTQEIVCGTLETSIEEVRGAMKNRRIRHLPLVDGDRKLLGLISIGDLNAHEATSQEQTIHLLQEYLYGRV
jgi:CBS domain-containing protein